MWRAVVLAVLAALAGCSVGFAPGGSPTPSPSPTAEPDRIGVEDGYRYDAPLATTANSSDVALEAVVARTTARIERLRGVEFRGDVEVVLLSRNEYRARNISFTPAVDHTASVRWEAAFMIGEDTDAGRVVDALFGGAVAGYYLPGSDRIVLVSESGERIDTRTLAHELIHALQDQRGWRVRGADSFDARLAATGLTEGEAVAVTRAYAARCSETWSCLPTEPTRGNVSAVVAHPGVYLTFRAPYVAGANFVSHLRERGGWPAVTAAYDRPPRSTRELLSPAVYPTDKSTPTVSDRSTGAWKRTGTDTVGQAATHAAFWANRLVARDDDAIATDYEDPYSEGLVADRIVVYRAGDRDGYVWRLRFVNASEASEFVDGYRRLLEQHDADRHGGGVYRIDSGPFADAFRIRRDGDTVTVVNGPTIASLDAIHG
ncbi:Hvo_1808 family surface protein [Halosegnis sp.]|uniref:Hvo_1808 family surface protein n=1 Tax=Halosegnis sp. TaxID=2864959 RepID=UPI0035D4CCC7